MTKYALAVGIFIGSFAIALLLIFLLRENNSYDDTDRAISMRPYKKSKIEVPVATGGEVNKIPVENYLQIYSGLVMGVNGKIAVSELPKVEALGADIRDGFEVSWSHPKNLPEGIFHGGAVPVTDDGYFITAAHNLKYKYHYLLYRSDNGENPSLVCSELRIVYEEKKLDFAIVKADFPTNKYLKLRADPLKEKELFFGGKWVAASATAGNLLRTKELYSKHGGDRIAFRQLISTNPIEKGDSGAPLIDSKGRVCGVLTGTFLGVFAKRKTAKTRSIMMDQEALFEIINQDRSVY